MVLKLSSGNLIGPTGAKYWEITQPGYYRVSCSLNTIANCAISVRCGNVVIDGGGYEISGDHRPDMSGYNPATDPNCSYFPRVYGVRVNAGLVSHSVIVKNLTVRNKEVGIIFEGVDGGQIIDCITTGNKYGIYIWWAANIQIGGNLVEQNEFGIVFDANEEKTCQINVIQGNSIQDNSSYGILLWLPCPENVIRANALVGNRAGGIVLTNGSSHNIISQNSIIDSENGIYLGEVDGNVLAMNEVMQCPNCGIVAINSDDTTLLKNTYQDCRENFGEVGCNGTERYGE